MLKNRIHAWITSQDFWGKCVVEGKVISFRNLFPPNAQSSMKVPSIKDLSLGSTLAAAREDVIKLS